MTDPINGTSALRAGTIVSFAFPLGEGEGGRAKRRPRLIIAVTQDGSEARVTIAYGTSATTESNRGLDLDLSAPDDWQAAGLRRPSRFVLARRVTVPASDPGLGSRSAASPVIGVLPPSAMVTLRRLTRSLGAIITEDRQRGSIGVRAKGRGDGRRSQRQRSRRELT